jgi:hypothetical protein
MQNREKRLVKLEKHKAAEEKVFDFLGFQVTAAQLRKAYDEVCGKTAGLPSENAARHSQHKAVAS